MTTTSHRIVLATRQSALALAQARAFAASLRALVPGLVVEELGVTTTGDRVQDRPLREIGGKGLFLKEIEEALLDGRADLAVHSMKDVPADLAPGLAMVCVPRREDPRDVLVSRSGAKFSELPSGSRIGTSSLRRTVQLRAARSDIEVVEMRGNVDTRLRKCDEGQVDAIVLAWAGLARLDLSTRVTEILDPDLCLPAGGQGALGVEARAGDAAIAALVAPLADLETSICVAAERGVLAAVEGSCDVPVGAWAERLGASIRLRAMLSEPDGSRLRRREAVLSASTTESEARQAGLEMGLSLKS